MKTRFFNCTALVFFLFMAYASAHTVNGNYSIKSPSDISVPLLFSKAFAPNSVYVGGKSTLTFTIDNTPNASAATNIAFTDNLPSGIVVADPNAKQSTCGGIITADPGTGTISFTGGTVAAGATGTVSVDVVATSTGTKDNETGDLTSSHGNSGKANANLEVTQTPLSISKSFTDDPVSPGGSVTIEFTITNTDRNFPATAIEFSDDLTTALAGLTFSSVNSNDLGGTLTGQGTTTISLTGGTLAADSDGTITVVLSVPAGASTGTHTNTTSTITGEIDGSGVTGNAASDDLYVQGLVVTKEFIGDPVTPGGTVTLRFTINNVDPTTDATAITFSDDLASVLPGSPDLTATAPPQSDDCGGTLIVPGGTLIIYTGGSVNKSSSCTVDVEVDVPAGATPGTYSNTTGSITAIMGDLITISPATDDLTISGLPEIDVQRPASTSIADGGTDDQGTKLQNIQISLTYTIENTGSSQLNVTNISSTAASNVTVDNIDPATLNIDGNSTDTFEVLYTPHAGGGAFSFELDISSNAAAPKDNYDIQVSGTRYTDPLFSFSKSFIDDPVLPGGTVTLEFTLTNNEPAATISNIEFTDNLNDVITGLAAIGPSTPDPPCGAVSSLTGAGFLVFTGGSILPQDTKTFTVPVKVPLDAAAGTYPNTTSELMVFGLPIANPATDDLVILPVPEIDIQRPAGTSVPGGGTDDVGNHFPGTVDLTYTVSNTGDVALTTTSPTFSNLNNVSSVTVTQAPPANIAKGDIGTFEIQFTVITTGNFSFDLTMNNNDVDENPYEFTVTGTGTNNPATISDIPNQTTLEDTPTPPIPFTIQDTEYPSDQLGVYGRSQNQDLVPDANIVIDGHHDERTVTITPAPDATGTTLISIYVSDRVENSVETFWLTVNPVDDPPTISDIPDLTTLEDVSTTPASFTISDQDTDTGQLTLQGKSTNPALIPDGNIVFGAVTGNIHGSESFLDTDTRTVTITPEANQSGSATIIISVADSTTSVSDTLGVTVTPVNDPPQFVGPLPPVTLTQGEEYSLACALLYPFVEDVDDPDSTLIWSVDPHPHLNPFVDTDSIRITAPTNWIGTDTLCIVVSDTTLSDSTDLIVTVQSAAGPGPPSNLTATIESKAIKLEWQPSTDPHVHQYHIYRALDQTGFDETDRIASVNHSQNSYLDQNVNQTVTYFYCVSAENAANQESANNPVATGTIATAIGHVNSKPNQFWLSQNHPNPFNPMTTITFGLPKRTDVHLAVYNMAGQIIQTLVDGSMDTGLHSVQWDAAAVPSGIYIYAIRTPEFSQVRKCMLMK